MSAPVGPEKRERAEAYALEAAEAEKRGDRRLAAALYRAAFLLLEDGNGEPEEAVESNRHGSPEWLLAVLGRSSRDGSEPPDGGSSG